AETHGNGLRYQGIVFDSRPADGTIDDWGDKPALPGNWIPSQKRRQITPSLTHELHGIDRTALPVPKKRSAFVLHNDLTGNFVGLDLNPDEISISRPVVNTVAQHLKYFPLVMQS